MGSCTPIRTVQGCKDERNYAGNYAVPIFYGVLVDLEFFIKRIDLISIPLIINHHPLIIVQLSQNPLDDSTNNYVMGYFYSPSYLPDLLGGAPGDGTVM